MNLSAIFPGVPQETLLQMAVALKSAIVAIVLDLVLGVIVAAVKGTFNFRELPKFLKENVALYVGGLLALGLVVFVEPTFLPLYIGAAGAVVVKFTLEIKDKVTAIFGQGAAEK